MTGSFAALRMTGRWLRIPAAWGQTPFFMNYNLTFTNAEQETGSVPSKLAQDDSRVALAVLGQTPFFYALHLTFTNAEQRNGVCPQAR